jgi:hypothetical protein
VSFKEMRGSIDLGYKTNSVELEKELYEWKSYLIQILLWLIS